MWTETNEEPGQMGLIWGELTESLRQHSWNQRKGEKEEAQGWGRGLGREFQRISCWQSWGLSALMLPSLVRCLWLSAGLYQAASMDQAQYTQWAGGCFLGQVDFLSWELCLAVGFILAFSLHLEPGMGSICFLITMRSSSATSTSM